MGTGRGLLDETAAYGVGVKLHLIRVVPGAHALGHHMVVIPGVRRRVDLDIVRWR